MLNLHTTTLARFFVKSVLHFLFTIWTHIRIFACLSTFFRVSACFADGRIKRAAAGSIGASSRATDTAIFPPYMGENGRTAAGCVSERFWGAWEGGLIGGWVRSSLPTGVKVVPGLRQVSTFDTGARRGKVASPDGTAGRHGTEKQARPTSTLKTEHPAAVPHSG